jgi:hypothetical protein
MLPGTEKFLALESNICLYVLHVRTIINHTGRAEGMRASGRVVHLFINLFLGN